MIAGSLVISKPMLVRWHMDFLPSLNNLFLPMTREVAVMLYYVDFQYFYVIFNTT